MLKEWPSDRPASSAQPLTLFWMIGTREHRAAWPQTPRHIASITVESEAPRALRPDTIDEWQTDALAFIRSLGPFETRPCLASQRGFNSSLKSIAQNIPSACADDLAGTSGLRRPRYQQRGLRVSETPWPGQQPEKKHPNILFSHSLKTAKAAADFSIVSASTQDSEFAATHIPSLAQGTAITKWGMAPKPTSLSGIQHPVRWDGDTD